ncbi:DMT family transporter [Paucidesulfovibrio gracilis]|uniref:DMT family transporter n=1 Tax=Paucidesulfovibrio gracilis TaxID=47158 RepID=UPI000999DB3E|nr:DMT family transporter [Paucidesulfovibrio gracilis]
MISSKTRGVLAALAATIIWSGNFVVARGLAEVIPPATLAFFRWSVACIALAPLALPSLRREWPALRRNFRYLVVTALLGVTLFNTLIYLAGRTTDTLNMSLISTCIPAFILLLSRIFLGEALTKARLTGLTAAFCGVLLLVGRGNPATLLAVRPNPGDIWMLLAALLFAAYSILVRRKPKDIGPTALLGASFGLGLLMLLPWTALEVAFGPVPQFSPTVFGSILYIGLGASLAAYWLWSCALEDIGPSQAGLIYYSLPLFSGLEAALLLGEPVAWFHGAAGILILGGIRLATRPSVKAA